MPQFLYFFPGLDSDSDAKIRALAPWAFERGDSIAKTQCHGPGDVSGRVCSRALDAQTDRRPIYEADRQDWLQSGDIWVGVWLDALPGPQDLARARTVPGAALPLGDGQVWTLPSALRDADGTPADGITQYMMTGNETRGERRVLRARQPLYLKALEVRDAIRAGASHTAEQAWPICLQCLAENYRVGPAEIGLLELMVDSAVVADGKQFSSWAVILSALIGFADLRPDPAPPTETPNG